MTTENLNGVPSYDDNDLQPKVRVVLSEIQAALLALFREGKEAMIYVGSTGLTEEEQAQLLEYLGRGAVTIAYTETNQPVEWYESEFHGVWIGTYKNQRDEASVYTIEICFYPKVAGAFREDIEISADDLATLIALDTGK